MAPRFPGPRKLRLAILIAALSAAPVAVLAQDDPKIAPPTRQKKLPEAPSKLPKVGADRTRGLDFLFGALKAAPDEASASMSRPGSGRSGCRPRAIRLRY